MAQWSAKRAEYERQQKIEAASRYAAEFRIQVATTERVLRAQGWQIEMIKVCLWKIVPPCGGAWMLCDTFEALRRKVAPICNCSGEPHHKGCPVAVRGTFETA